MTCTSTLTLSRVHAHTPIHCPSKSSFLIYTARYNGVYVGLLFRLITQTRWESGQGSLVKYLLRKITLGRGLIISICLVWLFGKAMWFMQAILGFIFQMWDEVQSVGDGWDTECVLRECRQFDLFFPENPSPYCKHISSFWGWYSSTCSIDPFTFLFLKLSFYV